MYWEEGRGSQRGSVGGFLFCLGFGEREGEVGKRMGFVRGVGGLCPHHSSHIRRGYALNGDEGLLGGCCIGCVGRHLFLWVG